MSDTHHTICQDIGPDTVVQNTSGKPIFRCSEKKARYYLRRGIADHTEDGQLRLVRDNIERVMVNKYGSLDSPYFLAPKFSKCSVCGSEDDLTQHHIVPKRHVKRIDPSIRHIMCNTLCVCRSCHNVYENLSIKEPIGNVLDHPVIYVIMWRDHFLETLKPNYLPEGWDILMPMPENEEI